MKQLKFMLAAATAVGFAAAAQAASLSNTPLVNDTFDGATLPAGYSYDGDVEADNESAVEEGVLKVNTGMDPLLRALDFGESARDINLASDKFDSLVIDTMVQFTVTPAGDEVKPNKDAEGKIVDKIMVYLAEATNETGVVTGTNLMVKAAKYTPATTRPQAPAKFEEADVVASGVPVVPGVWYRLVVTSSMHTDGFAQFKIQLATEGGDLVTLTNSEGLINTDNTLFPSLTGTDSATLTYVGFAGEGKVDDLKVNLFELATSVDFTLLSFDLDDGVKSVTYTIGEDTVTIEADTTEAIQVKHGTTVEISALAKEWFELGAYSTSYTASADDETKTITVASTAINTKVDPVTGEVTVNPSASNDVIAGLKTEAGITDGAFAETTDATELGKALTWQSKNKVSGEVVSAVEFKTAEVTNVNGSVETVFVADGPAAEAYLLNCDPNGTGDASLQTAKDNFKFEASDLTKLFDVDNTDELSFDSKNYNGTVILEGKGELSGEWKVKAVGHKFFRARLVK